jgi:hypothetical protein
MARSQVILVFTGSLPTSSVPLLTTLALTKISSSALMVLVGLTEVVFRNG